MTTLLAGDIGGTKTLLASYRVQDGGLEQDYCATYVSADWENLTRLVQHHLAGTEAQAAWGGERPTHACFAVAGPVVAGRATLTNLPWQLDGASLAVACGLRQVEIVNDFAVLIYGLPHLSAAQQVCLRPGVEQPGPVAILGAGTGLGVAFGVPGPGGLIAVASEASHGEFAPRTEEEWRLKRWLAADLELERVSIERVVSGTGLGHVTRWLLAEHDPEGHHPLTEPARCWAEAERRGGTERPDLPALVAAAGTGEADPLAAGALALWLGAYGSVAGDVALQSLCRGGLWLGGGTAGKLLPQLRSAAFLEPFAAKGRLSPVLRAMPLRALADPQAGLFSAACRARMLLG